MSATPHDPFTEPPGPARRELLAAAGMNVSPADFTEQETEQLRADAAAEAAVRPGAGKGAMTAADLAALS